MGFKLVNGASAVPLIVEREALEGVRLIAEKVKDDIRLVSGKQPKLEEPKKLKKPSGCVLVATVSHSSLLDLYEQEGLIDLRDIKGKREVFTFKVVGEGSHAVLIIAGSDKRGTIYGLFHLSECIGVSPWVYFADVLPEKQKEPEIPDRCLITSKEPSVKYRGFFINDEWPSFGGWTCEKFGGFTAKMYDKVFELLLRLKGNYLWPAMWSSSFPLDGPGLVSAELANTYGIVMGTSHHEPCLRASEEWDKVKGENTQYGTEWNYAHNKEGLLRYWEGGLKRSGNYENVITIGMRGERDSSMLGPNATLSENIELLKEIITEQRKLIAKHVNADTSQVPQMLALYKEVEAYYYGDADTPGLKEWDGLDGVTLMLCEDNFGNMRTLPTKEMRDHSGGFGMYYHFDYHGGPVSYEWVNSTPIEKVWEQMTEAYDYGVRDIWIVNVGDLKPQEFPLTYFMQLAYDFDTYGTNALNATGRFTSDFVEQQFGKGFTAQEKQEITYILTEYTRMNGIRRPEVMNAEVFHPVNYGETMRYYNRAGRLADSAAKLYHTCKKEQKAAFFELVYFPAVASANLIQMQLAAGLNHYYARHGMTIASQYAGQVRTAIIKDQELTAEYHRIADGKWNHMMSSAHIGFRSWNDEGYLYPMMYQVQGVPGSRAAVRIGNEERIYFGGTIPITVSIAGGTVPIEMANGGVLPVNFKLTTEGGISTEHTEGTYEQLTGIVIKVNGGDIGVAGKAVIKTEKQTFELVFTRVMPMLVKLKKEILTDKMVRQVQGNGEYVVFEASEFSRQKSGNGLTYQVLNHYGRTRDAIKAYPTILSVSEAVAKTHETAEVVYTVEAAEDGEYQVCLYVSPTNPLFKGDRQQLAIMANRGEVSVISTLPDGFDAGNCHNDQWNENVLNNIRSVVVDVTLKRGENEIVIGAVDAGVVLQRIVVYPAGKPLKKSYLGPLAD